MNGDHRVSCHQEAEKAARPQSRTRGPPTTIVQRARGSGGRRVSGRGGAGVGGEAMHCLTYYLMHHVCVVSNIQTKEANKLQHLLPLCKSL
jgi:hypothetical protein